jgi:hypothetical protein
MHIGRCTIVVLADVHAQEREGLRLGFADGGSHHGSAGRAQHVVGVAIGSGGDGKVAGARSHEGGRRADAFGRGGLG